MLSIYNSTALRSPLHRILIMAKNTTTFKRSLQCCYPLTDWPNVFDEWIGVLDLVYAKKY